MSDKITVSWGRDYRFASARYEFCVFDGELLIHREGAFRSSSAAKRAGIKAAQRFASAADCAA